jgi:hypothetical protein|eukprot:COSAG06_NODE_9707_length_1838_cov_1.692352_2_plen_73_part_00
MIAEVRKLGTNSSSGPVIYVMPPPPLMNDNRNPLNHTQEAVYPNQTIINSMLPILLPEIGRWENGLFCAILL